MPYETYETDSNDRPRLNVADDISTQVRTLMAWAEDRLADDAYDRQVIVEDLLDLLDTVAIRAVHADRDARRSVTAIAGTNGVSIAVGGITSGSGGAR